MEETPEVIHQQFINEIKDDVMKKYIELSSRLRANGIAAEFPEFAPVVHYLKTKLHTENINKICDDILPLLNFRRHADLALWHVSQSQSWYPYGATLRAIFVALQFLDTVQRTVDPELNTKVPFYHEFRYLYYFDYMINKSPDVVLIPTYSNITATTLVLTRGPPLFFVGISTDTLHVDEYIQTSAEFFIHDVNHGRRQYELSIQDYEQNWSKKMSLIDYYQMQITFLNKKIKPLIALKDLSIPIDPGLKQVIKIILFEIIHEDAQPAYPRLICNAILREAGHGDARFQVVYTNPKTKTPNIRKIANPGGGILGFVKYKLRYGFLDSSLNPVIVRPEYRTTENIASAAQYLLNYLSCENVPTIEVLRNLTDNMEGQNPPAHPNHLGEPYNVTKFTGKRPTPLPITYFEELYAQGVPWTGMSKIIVPLERRAVAYNATQEAKETSKVINAKGGRRKTRKHLRR